MCLHKCLFQVLEYQQPKHRQLERSASAAAAASGDGLRRQALRQQEKKSILFDGKSKKTSQILPGLDNGGIG
jgi:hypothetical protein